MGWAPLCVYLAKVYALTSRDLALTKSSISIKTPNGEYYCDA